MNKAMRSLRKVCYNYVKKLSGNPCKEEYMKKMIDQFAGMIVKLESYQGEMFLRTRISAMSEDEKNALRQLLNESTIN